MRTDIQRIVDDRQRRREYNDKLRASDPWRQFMTSQGIDPNGPIRLSDRQRKQLAQQLGLSGIQDVDIDPAGNLNTTHGWAGLPTWAKAAIAYSGAAVGGAGLAGVGPLAGGGSAAGVPGATGTGGALASTPVPTSGFAVGAPSLSPSTAPFGYSGSGAGGKPGFLKRIFGFGRKTKNAVGAATGTDRGGSNPYAEAIASLAGGLPALLANRQGQSDEEKALTRQMQEALKAQQARISYQDPLFQAVTRLAYGQMANTGTQGLNPYNDPNA